jgi:KipI family sensor histidine kinase inhibitor
MPSPAAAARLDWVADRCLRAAWDDGPGAQARVRAAVEALEGARLPALLDLVPAYASVLLTFDLARLEAPALERAVHAALSAPQEPDPTPSRLVEVPVCYCPACGPDLGEVARLHDLAPAEVARQHAAGDYRVAFLGFSPGFPYLLGLAASLATPRHERPRLVVPAGSVAIAGAQAGIYPQATPGGWRLLGRTSRVLFDASQPRPALLGPGDGVRFHPVPHAEHAARRGAAR